MTNILAKTISYCLALALPLAFVYPKAQAATKPGASKAPTISKAPGAPTPAILADNSLGGVDSPYTPQLNALIEKSRAATPSPALVSTSGPAKEDIVLECLGLKDNKYYIGARQEMVIHASAKAIAAIMDDIDHYKELFPGYKDIHVENRDGDKVISYWEQEMPIPFVDNVTYEMIYKFAWLNDTEKLYRYQLKAKTNLIASDGFIYLKELPNHDTLYIEYDFYDAQWGAAKSLGLRKIWYDSVEGMALSDLATKVKAEHPDLSNERAKKDGKKLVKSDTIVKCILPVL